MSSCLALEGVGNVLQGVDGALRGRVDLLQLLASGRVGFSVSKIRGQGPWSAMTSRAPAIVTTAVMGSRWSPPISNPPRKM